MHRSVKIAADGCCAILVLASIWLIKDDLCLEGPGLATAELGSVVLLLFVCVACLALSWRRGHEYLRPVVVREPYPGLAVQTLMESSGCDVTGVASSGMSRIRARLHGIELHA